MNKTFFIIGRNAALSTAEILAKYGNSAKSYSLSGEVFVLDGVNPKNVNIGELGGTIKVAEPIAEIKNSNYKIEDLIDLLVNEFGKYKESKSGKFHFGLSIYNLDGPKKVQSRLAKSINYIYINSKKQSKKEGIKLAFLRTKSQSLSSAAVLKNKLVSENGVEILLISSEESIYVAKTVGIQNIDRYTKLDVGRPARDMVSGTTPPKLAKLMINMAGKDKKSIVMDPFCGSGTYVQEMKLLGFSKIYGSDISEKAVSDTKKNLEWLKDLEGISMENIDVRVSDARNLEEFIEPNSVDAIVSEVYLGPPRRGLISSEEVEGLKKEMGEMYNEVFKSLSSAIKKDGRIVLALPAFRTGRGFEFLPIEDGLIKAGLSIINPNERIKEESWIKKSYTKRNTILYKREDQFVAREIIVLESKK